ncbi:uncharacterized protein LOC125018412 [Mugil cephalus]|uniref:uncharacterized protein LOC125018412 n=1 Tax=Mugil cephalus TaxID=48193 RepID=UPI001FB66840|nr:uncharacterized protein LOC125018412 [Mugil cephalus]
MKALCLILLFHASLQLQCDKTKITSHIGGEFVLVCWYDTSRYSLSKKYWCRGDSRKTCEVLVDSERVKKTKNTQRSFVVDARKRGLIVKVTQLQTDDTGVYWVGIDKIYADIMTSVHVVVTEVPVSKPTAWPLSSLVDRPTCWGEPVTVRCSCAKGTAIRYAWYQRTEPEHFLLHRSSDLSLDCATVGGGSEYYCTASNDVSSEESEIVSVQVLVPANSSCIYAVRVQGQPIYDCMDRISTTTPRPPPVTTTCHGVATEIHPDTRNQSLQANQTDGFFNRAWTGVPFWYTLLRWGCFASLLMILCIIHRCTNTRHKRHIKRRKKVPFRPVPHLAQ